MALDPKVEATLSKVGDEIGLPKEIWFPIVMSESGGNPTARALTDNEDSRGLFQVNIFAHPDANSVALYDPEYNARYQMPELKTYYDKGLEKGLSGLELVKYVERYGQRPQWSETVENNLTKYWQDLTGGSSSSETSNVTATQTAFSVTDFLTGDLKKNAALTGIYIFLFIVFLFSLYMIFINKTFVDDVAKKAGKKAIVAALA